MRKDCLAVNPSLLKPCCLWETKHLLVHLLPFEKIHSVVRRRKSVLLWWLLLSPSFEADPSCSRVQYTWHLVGVLDYNKEAGLYMVQKIHQKTKRRDKDGSSNQAKKNLDGIHPGWLVC